MLIPHRPLLWLASGWLALAVAAVVFVDLLPFWQGYGMLLAALALADALAGRALRGRLGVTRELAAALPVGTWQDVHLQLTSATPLRGWLRDRTPAGFASAGLPLAFSLPGGRRLQVSYRLHIGERGRHDFAAVDLRLVSPLALWLVAESLPLASSVRVYPDFARVTQYTLLATDNRLSQLGVMLRRRRGEGLEFHQLRDYRREDSLRQVDWKASARMQRLISREYQDERDQQLVFLLDCGVRMRSRDGELSHFDHTLNALLLLSYVALGQGDAVGLATFGNEAPRFLPPKKSVATVNRVLNAVYDLQPTLQIPDYQVAAENLLQRLSKRSLIVLVSNVRDEDDASLATAMQVLRRRHAVTLASLREPLLAELTAAPVDDFDTALTRAAALDYVRARQKQTALLRHAGVHVLDVAPAELPVSLINHYWQRKRAGSL